jgi:hypothetical protein
MINIFAYFLIYIRKPLITYDFAPDPIWIFLYMKNILCSIGSDICLADDCSFWSPVEIQVCHITVYFVKATYQNKFTAYKLSLHKKTKIFRKWQKTFDFSLLSSLSFGAVEKQDHYMTHFLSYVNSGKRCSRCQIHRYVAAPNTGIIPFIPDPTCQKRYICRLSGRIWKTRYTLFHCYSYPPYHNKISSNKVIP